MLKRLKSPATRLLVKQLHENSTSLADYEGIPPAIGGFPSQMDSNVESASVSWRHMMHFKSAASAPRFQRSVWIIHDIE